MIKITAEHLARSAYVYIRQSTHDQLVHNRESRRRQYGLADRARRSRSSTMIWVARAVGSADLGSSACWPRFARVVSALCSRSRRLGWRATVVTGTH